MSPVLAIGIDAADPGYVRKLMESGDLPVMAELAQRGVMGTVESPAWIGSGAVWPTFFSGDAPSIHGIHSAWAWDPQAMRVGRVGVDSLTPAWRDLEANGTTFGCFDVPFTPRMTPTAGCAVVEWGAHDWVHDGGTHAHPSSAADCVRSVPAHPFSRSPVHAWGDLRDPEARRTFLADAKRGVSDRAMLAERLLAAHELDAFIVVCSEVHRASHLFWHAADETHPAHEAASAEGLDVGLREIFQETDRLVGQLLNAVGGEAPVLIFSLHGMRSSPGVPELLAALLREEGFATPSNAPRVQLREFLRGAIRTLRPYLPARLKSVYHAVLPGDAAIRIAGPDEQVSDWEWERTECFPLPTDQHGWLRINLAGREARGIVPRARYEQICSRLERWLRDLMGDHGRPLVTDVRRTALAGEPPAALPDLVVQWDEWAVTETGFVRGYDVRPRMRAQNITGQHRPEGWYMEVGTSASELGPSRSPEELSTRLSTLILKRYEGRR